MRINKIKTWSVKFVGAVTALTLITTSCSDSFLDVDPQGQAPAEQFWVNEDDATKAVNSMYGNLRSWPQVAFA